MSGIAGIIRFDGAPVEPGSVEEMTSAMSHRGSDGTHHWVKGSVALGQCMLCTTPESLEEKQPLTNEDETLVLVMDGRVDNWEELRKELLGRGTRLRDRSDAELVLRSYGTWGRDCLAHIDGDFALVIWDARSRTVFCARDRMGNKPFNYHWDGTALAFSSELHAILRLPWVKQELNEGMLAEFLAAEWHSRDETFWSGVLRLVAAHRMEVGEQGPRPEQYWEPDLFAELPFTKDEEYIDCYRDIFRDAVRRMSRSHRTVAFEVSGGLDSSALFCMAEHLRRSGELPVPGIDGYTLAFQDGSAADDLVHARKVGSHLGVPLHEVQPASMDGSWYASEARSKRGFPGYPNGVMSHTLYRMAARAESRVLMNGGGGDEWLSGSRAYYREELSLRNWGALAECLRNDGRAYGVRQTAVWFCRHVVFDSLAPVAQNGVRHLLGRGGNAGARPESWLSIRMRNAISSRRTISRAADRRPLARAGQHALVNLLEDAHGQLAAELTECDCAEKGLELRRPLRTQGIVQFAFSTPERIRSRGDLNKHAHRMALHGIVPQAVLDRRSKADFSVIFRAHLDREAETIVDTIPRKRPGLVDGVGVTRLFGTYRRHSQLGWPMWALWGIYGCDKFLDGTVENSPPGEAQGQWTSGSS